jgi:hypothetical protein
MQRDAWAAEIATLTLPKLVQQVALNAWKEVNEQGVTLHLRSSQRHLNSSASSGVFSCSSAERKAFGVATGSGLISSCCWAFRVQQVALNAWKEVNEQGVTLHLRSSQRHLNSAPARQAIQDALSRVAISAAQASRCSASSASLSASSGVFSCSSAERKAFGVATGSGLISSKKE